MPTTYVKSGGTWRTTRNLFAHASAAWRNVRNGYVKSSGIWRLVFTNTISLNISANTTDYNVRTAALAAGWNGTDLTNIVLTINAGIFVRASSTSAYAIDTGGSWPVGATITIINNGFIQGKGGVGGAGGDAQSPILPTNGTAAGHAMNLQFPVSIDNTSGFILGGGGGGGGGGGEYAQCNCGKFSCDEDLKVGGGGGGGAGTGAGGIGGNNGAAGTNIATSGANGTGGAGLGPGPCSQISKAGGNGGDWGTDGSAGTSGSQTGGSGGAAGKAIKTNANAVTWIAGNNPTQVRGAVS